MILNISEILSTARKSECYSIPLEMTFFVLNGQKYSIVRSEPVQLTISNIGNREMCIRDRSYTAGRSDHGDTFR